MPPVCRVNTALSEAPVFHALNSTGSKSLTVIENLRTQQMEREAANEPHHHSVNGRSDDAMGAVDLQSGEGDAVGHRCIDRDRVFEPGGEGYL